MKEIGRRLIFEYPFKDKKRVAFIVILSETNCR